VFKLVDNFFLAVTQRLKGVNSAAQGWHAFAYMVLDQAFIDLKGAWRMMMDISFEYVSSEVDQRAYQ
jgi:flagellar motor switch protein FliM